jgi:hypothetical protein
MITTWPVFWLGLNAVVGLVLVAGTVLAKSVASMWGSRSYSLSNAQPHAGPGLA